MVSGKWYSPPEFEILAGKKARKWRQSLHHQGKPLSHFPISGLLGKQGSSQCGRLDLSAGLQDVDLSRSLSVCGLGSTQPGGHSVGLVNVSTSCDAFVVVLSCVL